MRAGFDIVTMEAEHLDLVVEAGVEFFNESNLNGWLTVNRAGYRTMLEDSLDNGGVASFLAVSCNQVVGYIHIYCQNEYTVEPVGELFQFFVRPEWRGTGVARSLIEAAQAQYIAWGCKRAYAEAAPGLRDPRHLNLFRNLFGKFGYEPIGATFMKDFR